MIPQARQSVHLFSGRALLTSEIGPDRAFTFVNESIFYPGYSDLRVQVREAGGLSMHPRGGQNARRGPDAPCMTATEWSSRSFQERAT